MKRVWSPWRGRFVAAAAAIVTLGLGSSLLITSATANVSHVGWPHRDTEWFASNVGQVGIGTDGNDLLLGGAGSDTISGGPGDDVIWGDRYPSPNGPDQHDVLDGGPGNDWIYASHGTNTVSAGAGDDHIIAYYGTGTVDCGSGFDIVYVPSLKDHAYTMKNCESVRPYPGNVPLS